MLLREHVILGTYSAKVEFPNKSASVSEQIEHEVNGCRLIFYSVLGVYSSFL